VNVKVGQSLVSTTDATTVIVVRAPQGDIALTCGGAEMVDSKQAGDTPKTEAAAGHAEGTQLGKRYESADASLELLCTKPGTSSLAVDGELLALKAAKPLPASD
jgi:hypothetical protein